MNSFLFVNLVIIINKGKKVCGERNHQQIVETIEENVASLFKYEKVCVLLNEDQNLVKLQGCRTDKGELYTS